MGVEMYPHVMTLYSKNGDNYERIVVRDVLWQEQNGLAYKKVADDESSVVEVHIRNVACSIKKDDVIVLGEQTYEVKHSGRELFDQFPDAVRVKAVGRYEFGSPMDHLEVIAK